MGLHVIMMGPPGAGKGTQGARLARERGLVRVSTGDILRDAIRAKTPMGVKVETIMGRGELVDDETMIAIVRDRLMQPDAKAGFLLDGFPRTVPQAEALDRIMDEGPNAPLLVLDVRVPFRELMRRLGSRRICASCGANADPFAAMSSACGVCGGSFVQRSDDGHDTVAKRLRVYERQTFPLVEYYQNRPTFRVVNGAQAPDKVAFEMDTLLDDAAAVGASAGKTMQS
ncbi:MAG: adenylate kinase [Vicinamibacterales bacterium]